MTGAIPVVASLDAYRVAAASLPVRARLASDAAGAIVVVDGGAGWWDAAAAAVDRGARAVVVSEPREVPVERVAELLAASTVPIVVHRARLRLDLVDRAVEARDGVAPRVVVAEVRGSSAALRPIVRDAVGWIRALSGGDSGLEVASTGATPGGSTALLRSRDDRRVVGSMIVAASQPKGELLRIRALGETATELELDAAMGRSELATSTARGRMLSPGRFEEGERTAVRRALDAVASGSSTLPDLEELLHDATAAVTIAPFVPESSFFS